MNNIQELYEFKGELPTCNPEWFKGYGFMTMGICGHNFTQPSQWVSIHRGTEPPEEFDEHTHWVCGEIVRKWSGKRWEITGRLQESNKSP